MKVQQIVAVIELKPWIRKDALSREGCLGAHQNPEGFIHMSHVQLPHCGDNLVPVTYEPRLRQRASPNVQGCQGRRPDLSYEVGIGSFHRNEITTLHSYVRHCDAGLVTRANMALPQSSSKARMSNGTERLVFKFEFSLRDDIQDVVNSGTHGHFREARSLADDSLKQFDEVFPIAVEITRLMYDQGDVDALCAYINHLVNPFDRRGPRTKHRSWTAKQLCIVHLMQDTCGILSDNPAKVTTTPRDVFPANLNVRKFEDLDDEQVSSFHPYTTAYAHDSHALDFCHSDDTQNGIHCACNQMRTSERQFTISPYHTTARKRPLPVRWVPLASRTVLGGCKCDDNLLPLG
jgi:hypothetical protein